MFFLNVFFIIMFAAFAFAICVAKATGDLRCGALG
jgi:hypothetical protein